MSVNLFLTFETLVLIPYFAWGIYTLRLRYTHHEELPLRLELVTLAAVTVFIAVNFFVARAWMRDEPLLLILTFLGLFVSAAALYGPMVLSLTSHHVTEIVHPSEHDFDDDGPQLHWGEAHEHKGDYERAVNTYLEMAEAHTSDPEVSMRVADNLAKLGRFEEAAPHFMQALRGITDPERALHVTNRLVEIYARRLDETNKAIEVLEEYAARYPQSTRLDSVRARIARLSGESSASSTVAQHGGANGPTRPAPEDPSE